MKSECHCASEKVATISVAEYNNDNQLEVSYIEVCENCKKWYEDLGLILTDDKIKKYFG
jgi:hypothetical protein